MIGSSRSFEYREPFCVGQGSASELTSLRSPRDVNGNGYFYVRLCWTGLLFSAVLHVAVALKRTRVDPVVVTR